MALNVPVTRDLEACRGQHTDNPWCCAGVGEALPREPGHVRAKHLSLAEVPSTSTSVQEDEHRAEEDRR
jgi:hypothetical protein